MILKETIDSVFNLPIVEVIGSYIELKRNGANYKGLSPFTGEKTASLMVSPSKNIWKDFSSGKGGNAIGFVMEKEHLDYPDAIREICKKFGIPVLESAKTDEETMEALHKESLYIINAVAKEYYVHNVSDPSIMNYITVDRGFNAEMIQRFQIGYAPPALSGLVNIILSKQLNWQHAVEASVISYHVDKNMLYDRFRQRLIFPIRNIAGHLVGFGGRIVGEYDKSKVAKYINSSDSIVYNKSHILYGLFESKNAIVKNDHAFLCEGYSDVVQFHQRGIENIVSTSGTALTPEMVKLLKRFTKNVTVMFDGDNAGINATMRGIDVLLAEDMSVKVLLMPDGMDPDDFAKVNELKYIQDYVYANSKDFVRFKLNYLLNLAGDDLGLRTNALIDTVNSISKIPNPIKREVYLKECSRIGDINEASVRQMLKSAIEEEADFSEVTFDSFQDQSNLTRQLMREQCEKKILQYVLAYGQRSFSFLELYLEDGTEEPANVSRTVIGKVVFELEEDGFTFINPSYAQILEKAKSVDLSHFYLLKDSLPAELYLLAEALRNEELSMNTNVFTNPDIEGAEIVQRQLDEALVKSINETLLFYKTIHIEDMMDEEAKKETPDMETIAGLVGLLVKIKHELNFI